MLDPQFFDPFIFFEVVYDQIPEQFVKVVHATVEQEKTPEYPCDMVPTSETLKFVLLTLVPKARV